MISANGDYQYIAGFAGAALSGEVLFGEVLFGEVVLTPRVGFDYIYSPGADVEVIAELSGLEQAGKLELDAVAGGRVFAEVRGQYPLDDGFATLSISPRIACYQSLGALDGVCGAGGSIGISSTDQDAALTYAVELDGEWGENYTHGSLSLSAARQLEIGVLSADVDMTLRGSVGIGGAYEMQF